MHRSRLKAFALAVLVLATPLLSACGAEPLPGMDEVRSIDLTPTNELVLDGSLRVEVTIPANSVLAIRNATEQESRLRAEEFDTGLMQPGDELLVTFAEPTVVQWADELGDAEGTITVRTSP